MLHMLLPLETVTNSESSDTEAYSHFNNVLQTINMAFCTETFLIGFILGPNVTSLHPGFNVLSFRTSALFQMAGPAVSLCVGNYCLNSALTRVYSTL